MEQEKCCYLCTILFFFYYKIILEVYSMKKITKANTVSWIILIAFLFLMTGCSTGTLSTNHAPTINSIPITNSLVDVLYTYDVEASDSDGDTLVYSLTSAPSGMTINSSTGVINWTPDTIGDYSVVLRVSDGESFDTQNFTLSISLTEITTLSAPTNVSASDNIINKVQITWDAVSSATHYQVYKADALLGTKTALSGWQTGTTYDDTTVDAGVTYYYWVKAAESSSGDNASEYSDYDEGHSVLLIPIPLDLDPPKNVSASDNKISKVQITWDEVTEATHYRVYRSPSLLMKPSAVSEWQSDMSYEDDSVNAGTSYYYRVKAATSSSGYNASDYSDYDEGHSVLFIPVPLDLDPPTKVLASDNLLNRVEIKWCTVSGATHYRVYRSPSLLMKPSAVSEWQVDISYEDDSVIAGTSYYYRVKAATSSSGYNASEYSDYDEGHSVLFIPMP
jgi:fibronectin type 3 domain-containing protein